MVVSQQRIPEFKDGWFFLMLSLLLFCNADDSWLRITGPRTVYRGFRILPHSRLTSVSSRSLITCISACLASDVPCVSVNYQQRSGTCDLLASGSSKAEMAENPGWSTVTLAEQQEPESLTTSTTTVATTATASQCPVDFVVSGDKCYFLDGGKESVPRAFLACRNISASLLSIETQEEQNMMHQLLARYNPAFFWWTSGQGSGTDRYLWSSTGHTLAYSNFSNGFPGGYYGGDSCIYIDGSSLDWKLDNCEHGIHHFICEYP